MHRASVNTNIPTYLLTTYIHRYMQKYTYQAELNPLLNSHITISKGAVFIKFLRNENEGDKKEALCLRRT